MDTKNNGYSKVCIFILLEHSSHLSELCSQACVPAAVAQELSSNGSILAQPSPYKNYPSYPTSVILSPAKNKKTTITSVPSMSPLASVASSSSHRTVIVDSSPSQSSSVVAANMLHVPTSAAPPPLDGTLQPHPPNIQRLPNGDSNTTMKASVTPDPNHDNTKDPGNKLGHNMIPKDPSCALIEQHNVRMVPAVLSFGSLSSFSASTSSTLQHNIPQSSVLVNNNNIASVTSSQPSVTTTSPPSLFKPSDIYNSPSISHVSNTVSWLHPNRPLVTDATSYWISRTVQSDSKVMLLILNQCVACHKKPVMFA